MLFIDMMLDEIEVLNFGHGGMYSIHCWNRFLYIIRAHFYILLEQLFMHLYTIIYIAGAHFHIVRKLLAYIVGTFIPPLSFVCLSS